MASGQRVAIGIAAVPFLVVLFLLLSGGGREPIFPGLDPARVSRIEMVQGDTRLELRRGDSGWVVASAADAPGNAARIDAMIDSMAHLRGRSVTSAVPQRRQPLSLTFRDASGASLGAAGFWTGEAQRLGPNGEPGQRLTLAETPALPLWPSAWSSLRAPAIAPGAIRSAERITPSGTVQLTPAGAAEANMVLSEIASPGFVVASDLNWTGSPTLRLHLKDESIVDAQQTQSADGQLYVRMASDTRADVRAARLFAFPVRRSLP